MNSKLPKLTKAAISKIESLVYLKAEDIKLSENSAEAGISKQGSESTNSAKKAIGVDYFLRLSVLGGGCAGFKYEFLLDSEIFDDDEIIKAKMGVYLVVDKVSLSLIPDATIDFKHELIGSNFTISNPLADSACGCGASFNIKA